MKISVSLSLAIHFYILLLPASQAQTADTLSFLHITDTHIADLSGYHADVAERRKHYGRGAEPFTNFIARAPGKYKASFIALTGDMIDFYEGETPSNRMQAGQIENFTRLLSASSIPVYMTLGNHDIKSNYSSTTPDYATKPYYAADEQARAKWIQNVSCFENGAYYSRIVKIDATVYRLIFLDNSYYKEKEQRNTGVPFVMDFRQLYWLENQLRASDTDTEIVFMHMPLPWGNPEEQVSALADSGPEASGLYNLLNEHSSIRLILTGHEHESAMKDFQTKAGTKITQLMTGAFGRDQNNWRLVRLTKDSILISETGSPAIQKSIPIRQ